MAYYRCAACGLPTHRYDTSTPNPNMQACINMLIREIDLLKTADLYRQGWDDAVEVVRDALETAGREPRR